VKKLLTIVWVRYNGQILLGMKKRGFGVGRWNGFGGKVATGESVEDAARRELQEEVGLVADKLFPAGVIEFTFENDDTILETHVFTTSSFTGDPIETEEMQSQWFSEADLPFEQMWSTDKHWLPKILLGKIIRAEFHMDTPEAQNILHFNITES
jgi:8-oxo-dGTP diphosphatase / 2-hydroxy-dATP diphosphatase